MAAWIASYENEPSRPRWKFEKIQAVWCEIGSGPDASSVAFEMSPTT